MIQEDGDLKPNDAMLVLHLSSDVGRVLHNDVAPDLMPTPESVVMDDVLEDIFRKRAAAYRAQISNWDD